MNQVPILSIEDAVVRFPMPHGVVDMMLRKPQLAVHALNSVKVEVQRGETLGIVGESGCGKSTLARAVVRLVSLHAGRILYNGTEISSFAGTKLRDYNRRVQMVFQDPNGSLNPRMTVGQVLTEALAVHGMRSPAAIPSRVSELLELVKMPADAANRLPHQFSGGQRQRIGIARALAVEPEIIVADEIVSALDVSVQAQVVNLLLELQSQLSLTLIFVAHDLRLVRHISHRVAVMYLGSVMEVGNTEDLFAAPRHPYTRALLDAAPDIDPDRKTRAAITLGELPSPLRPPPGCPFSTRCSHSIDRCRIERPALTARGPTHQAACHIADFGLPAR